MRSLAATFGVALLLLLPGAAHAQTTFASITGTITDGTGAVVPNASITVRSLATNIETRTTSNDVGNYTVPQLKEGPYSVRATAHGFNEVVVGEVFLVARDVRRIDLVLPVGASTVAIEVTAGATVIETETARINDTKDAGRLATLPQVNRSIWAPLALSPTVLQSSTGSTVRFAGSSVNQSNWSMDGISFSNPVDGTQMGPAANYLEWVGELKVDYANNTADVGPIGQVTIITKSGTNEFHGGAFDYYSTRGFRARNPFTTASPIGVLHQPGVSAGGPVYLPKIYNGKNRSFFFTNFETARGSTIYQFLNGTVPTSAMRQGDFSELFLYDVAIRDPLSGEPFPDNIIPSSRINPVARKLQEEFYPLPNFGDVNSFTDQNYRLPVSRPKDYSTYWVLRGDHRISDSTSVYGRYTNQAVDYPYLWGSLETLGQSIYNRFNRAAVVALTHTLSPTMVLESRWGFANDKIEMSSKVDGLDFVNRYGLEGLAPDLPDIKGMMAVNILYLTPLSQVSYRNSRSPENQVQNFQQYFNWFRGRHAVKAGYDLTRGSLNSFTASGSLFGNLSFTDRYTDFSYADFLLGIPTTVSRAFAPIELEANRWQHDFFITDDFKVTPQLTLNLGVRYELHLPWRENNGRMAMFDVISGNLVVPRGSLSKVSNLFPSSFAGVIEAQDLGLPGSTILRPDRNNFAPRIGIAYRPWGERTVLRAGWGVYYNVVPPTLQMGAVSPFAIQENAYTNPLENPDVILPRVFPSAGSAGPSSVALPLSVNPGIRTPYTMQYNFTIEREQWNTGFRVSYIGSGTRQGEWTYDYNSPVPNAMPYVSKARPYPQYSGLAYQTNGAVAQYNALTVEAKRQRLHKGLHFQASWSWARGIYDLERGQSPENSFDRRRERAVSQDIPTHRFTTNVMYQLPFGRGRHWLSSVSRPVNWAIGGWETSITYNYFSGNFLTPYWCGSDPVGTAYTGSSTPAFVCIRPDQIGDPNLPSSQRSVTGWFDTGAFTAPQTGQYGTAAKGVIKGPHVNVWHAGVFKDILLEEKHGLSLRLEMLATNVLNHPNWSNPATVITNLNAGYINNVGTVQGGATGDDPGARQLRAGIRLRW